MTADPYYPNPIVHGTNNGYVDHLRRGHATSWRDGTLNRCEPCTEAHRAYVADNRRTKRLLRLRTAARRTKATLQETS